MKKLLFLLGLLLCAQVLLTAGPNQELEKAKILPKIICQDNPENSYALFLPSAYSPEKEWPILYALDPGARGEVPVVLFRKAAETYGFILIGSNDSRNGPWQPSIQAMIAIWNDTNNRFSIDKKRIYVTGFSGGSRAASIFARVIRHPVAGIIGCGAGLATNLIKPERISPAYYLGIVGIVDFNFREMMLLRDQFEQHDISHRFLVHPGGHEWPTEDICQRAIEWMEVIGIRNDIRAMDEDLIDTVFEKEREIALSLESTGDLSHALSNYQVLLETFSTWKDTGPIQDKIQIIQKNKGYLRDAHAENRIQGLEIQHLRKFGQVLSQIEKNSPPIEYIESVIANLGLEELKTKAAKRKAGKESFMAIRLLHSLEIDAYSKGWDCFQKEELIKAIFFFAIAAKGGNEESPMKKSIYYNLACAYARNQNNKKALENLKLAVEHGFDNIENM
jgi:predicted esterase